MHKAFPKYAVEFAFCFADLYIGLISGCQFKDGICFSAVYVSALIQFGFGSRVKRTAERIDIEKSWTPESANIIAEERQHQRFLRL